MTAPPIAAILYPPPGSPFVLMAGAAALLALHVGGGVIGVLSGFGALIAPKGGRLHRLSGKLFLVSMLVMTGVAACTAPFMATQQWSNTIAGCFTFYLVVTGWLAARLGPGRIAGPIAAMAAVPLCVLAVIALGFALGTNGADGAPAPAPYLMGALATLAAVGDARAAWRAGLSGAQRLARHLWRLCAALLIATGSGLSQPRIAPAALRDSPLALLPILAILGMMIFWLVRLSSRGARQPTGLALRAAGLT